jgi:hypothetical protein
MNVYIRYKMPKLIAFLIIILSITVSLSIMLKVPKVVDMFSNHYITATSINIIDDIAPSMPLPEIEIQPEPQRQSQSQRQTVVAPSRSESVSVESSRPTIQPTVQTSVPPQQVDSGMVAAVLNNTNSVSQPALFRTCPRYYSQSSTDTDTCNLHSCPEGYALGTYAGQGPVTKCFPVQSTWDYQLSSCPSAFFISKDRFSCLNPLGAIAQLPPTKSKASCSCPANHSRETVDNETRCLSVCPDNGVPNGESCIRRGSYPRQRQDPINGRCPNVNYQYVEEDKTCYVRNCSGTSAAVDPNDHTKCTSLRRAERQEAQLTCT